MIVADSEPVDVPAVNFAEVLRETGVPLFMKIDIEGSDRLCLKALLDLEQRPRWVSIEASKTELASVELDLSLLERPGYDRFAVVQQGTIPGSETLTQTLDGAPLKFRFDDDSSGGFGPDVVRGWIAPRRSPSTGASFSPTGSWARNRPCAELVSDAGCTGRSSRR